MPSSSIQTLILEGPITTYRADSQDLVGQQLADSITNYYVSLVGVIGFISGYIAQDIKITVYTCAVLFTIGFFVVVPPWPAYKRNPLKFLDPTPKN